MLPMHQGCTVLGRSCSAYRPRKCRDPHPPQCQGSGQRGVPAGSTAGSAGHSRSTAQHSTSRASHKHACLRVAQRAGRGLAQLGAAVGHEVPDDGGEGEDVACRLGE